MTYTLYADGRSDEVLIPLLTWSLRRLQVTPVTAQFVDFDRLPRRDSDKARLEMILDLYPCDLLFVHRDAESQPHETRRAEIAAAVNEIGVRHVPVVPVRMTEAWLLTDEKAIRSAAGNLRGTEELNSSRLRAD